MGEPEIIWVKSGSVEESLRSVLRMLRMVRLLRCLAGMESSN